MVRWEGDEGLWRSCSGGGTGTFWTIFRGTEQQVEGESKPARSFWGWTVALVPKR